MFIHSRLVILMLALTLDGRVHTGDIIGGDKAVPHSRPYMALLKLHMEHDKPTYCDGFLLNEDFVMTAAHCQAKSYTVFLGVHSVHDENIQTISVTQAFPHQDYHDSDYTNDIMLLKLSSKANFSENVKPIALASQGNGSSPKSCIVSGWGITDENRPQVSLYLMEVNVTLSDSKKCPRTNLYCSEGANGPSKGDSGGPLVCEDGKAYGVVSTSFKLTIDSPHIYTYTKIPDYESWINSAMEHHAKTTN